MFYKGSEVSPKIAPPLGGSGPPLNTRFLEPTQVHVPSGTSIGSAAFVGLTVVTNRQTHRETTLHLYQ